jgi:hypothetical protein
LLPPKEIEIENAAPRAKRDPRDIRRSPGADEPSEQKIRF